MEGKDEVSARIKSKGRMKDQKDVGMGLRDVGSNELGMKGQRDEGRVKGRKGCEDEP